MQISPIHYWIAAKLGQPPGAELDLGALRALQLERLNGTLTHALANSPFYRQRLHPWQNRPLASLQQLAELPFTTAEDLREQGLQMLGVSQSAIERVVTLESSGTTGAAKRLYFTGEELARTQAFFRLGMAPFLDPGERILILLPGELPASAGNLLAHALQPLGVECLIEGVVTDPGRCASLLAEQDIACVVGIPVQVLSVLRHPHASRIAHDRIRSVFLTSDYVPSALIAEIQRQWGCPAFNHYGMTELAMTGGVECQALDGYHRREPDLYFEVIDPATGRVLPAGETGEVVVTTLTRTGMPLIRYRTDDLARFLPKPCPCGSNLPRLGKLRGRLAKQVGLGAAQRLGMPDLDEALFVIPGLVNFRAVLTAEAGINHLALTVETVAGQELDILLEVSRRLPLVPSIRAALAAGTLRLMPAVLCKTPLPVSATVKRNIEDHRKEM
jgi:phenylacetate-CoA ligase